MFSEAQNKNEKIYMSKQEMCSEVTERCFIGIVSCLPLDETKKIAYNIYD